MKLVVLMCTVLIIFCNGNKIMAYKTKKFASTSNKKYTFFIIANASYPIKTIKTLNPIDSMYCMFQHKPNLIWKFPFFLQF